jgi:hypothetical protein
MHGLMKVVLGLTLLPLGIALALALILFEPGLRTAARCIRGHRYDDEPRWTDGLSETPRHTQRGHDS